MVEVVSPDPNDYHAVVFRKIDGEQMVVRCPSVLSADRVEARIKTGTYFSLENVQFVDRQHRNAEWHRFSAEAKREVCSS